MAEAGNLKLDILTMHSNSFFFGLNTFLDVIEVPTPQKPFYRYGHLNTKYKIFFHNLTVPKTKY